MEKVKDRQHSTNW